MSCDDSINNDNLGRVIMNYFDAIPLFDLL